LLQLCCNIFNHLYFRDCQLTKQLLRKNRVQLMLFLLSISLARSLSL
jgi:hypothetical protein